MRRDQLCAETNGDFTALTFEEKVRIAQEVADEVNGRAKVIFNAGMPANLRDRAACPRVRPDRVDGIAVITPFSIACTQDGLERHVTSVADAVETPMYRSPRGSEWRNGRCASWMLLASEGLKVIYVSTHVALKTAIDRATPQRVSEAIRAGHEHLQRVGIAKPRIAVAGINPHCGEGGIFGSEDDEQMVPGAHKARDEGIDVSGPISADTVFHHAHAGGFDLVLAQYHDQGISRSSSLRSTRR